MLSLFISKTWVKGCYFSGQAHGRHCLIISGDGYLQIVFWNLEYGKFGSSRSCIGTQKWIRRRDSDWCEHEKRVCWYSMNNFIVSFNRQECMLFLFILKTWMKDILSGLAHGRPCVIVPGDSFLQIVATLVQNWRICWDGSPRSCKVTWKGMRKRDSDWWEQCAFNEKRACSRVENLCSRYNTYSLI